MRRLLLILLLLNAIGLILAMSIFLLAVVETAGLVPHLASWPHDLKVINRSGQTVKVTPIVAGPDGSLAPAILFPDRQTHRALDPPGGLTILIDGELSLVYDRENRELEALVIEDAHGALFQLPIKRPGHNEGATVVIERVTVLEPMPDNYRIAFLAAQARVGRFPTWLWWMILLPWFTLALLLVGYRAVRQVAARHERVDAGLQ